MSSRDHAAGIAGLCFLGAGAITLAALVSAVLIRYGHAWREALLALLGPQFAFGMYMGWVVVVFAWLLWRAWR